MSKIDESKKIGNFIAELRKENNMTQEELLDMRDTITNLIQYEANKQIKDYKKFKSYL